MKALTIVTLSCVLAMGCLLCTSDIFSGIVSAGTEEEPEITDPTGDADDVRRPTEGNVDQLDIISSWFTEEEEGILTVTIAINSIPSEADIEAESDYSIIWHYEGTTDEDEWYAWMRTDSDSNMRWEYGRRNDGAYNEIDDTTGTVEYGTPAYVTIDLPLEGILVGESQDILQANARTHRDHRLDGTGFYSLDGTEYAATYTVGEGDGGDDGSVACG